MRTRAYYNENDKKTAAWLRELIKAGLIADGDVDDRSIEDVVPTELAGYTQCHFFAGIGGWSYALRLAGWPDDRPVWTGSCPCQPFSQGGLGSGATDARHLWPVWFPLIKKCQPAAVFGEQVSGPSGYSWIDLVGCDLEDEGYAFAAADMPVACVDYAHTRYRFWWVATNSDPNCFGRERFISQPQSTPRQDAIVRCREFERLVSRLRRVAVPAGSSGAVSDGVSGRVGRLRGYGNAIVPQVAQVFIESYLDCIGG